MALADRGIDLLVREAGRLRAAVAATRGERPFQIDAMVVLLDHLHCVWTLPEGNSDFSTRWGAIKARFTRAVNEGEAGDVAGYNPTLRSAAQPRRAGLYPAKEPTAPSIRRAGFHPAKAGTAPHTRAARFHPATPTPSRKGDAGLWQRRFWEHLIRDEHDYARHLEYCWINPVKHGLVGHVRDWQHSTFHREVRRGVVPEDWAGTFPDGAYGEPIRVR